MHHRIVAARGRLALCCIADQILEAFKITHLDRVFEIFRTREAALAAFK